MQLLLYFNITFIIKHHINIYNQTSYYIYSLYIYKNEYIFINLYINNSS